MENEMTNFGDLYLYIIRFDGLREFCSHSQKGSAWKSSAWGTIYNIADIKQNGKYKRKPTDDDYRFIITTKRRMWPDGEWVYQGEAHIPAATEEDAIEWLDSYIKKFLRNGEVYDSQVSKEE